MIKLYNDYLEQQVQLLNEQYYGKNVMTLEMEKIFGELKEELDKNSIGEIPHDRILVYEKRLIKCIKELFNFKQVNLNIVNIGSTNAFTLSATLEDTFKGLLTDKEENKKYGGIQYTDNANRALTAVISLEIVRKKEFTPAMLVAVLLHEIGHNFFIENSISYRCDMLILAYMIVSVPYENANLLLLGNAFIGMITTNTCRTVLNTVTNKIKDTKIAALMLQITNALLRINGFIKTINIVKNVGLFIKSNPIKRGIMFVIGQIEYLIRFPLKIFHTLKGYNDEIFADNFATSYGYGKEIAEVNKVFALDSTGSELLDSFRNLNFATKLLTDFCLKLDSVFEQINIFKMDGHSNEATRMIDQLNYLEANLNDIKSPEKRKAIENDLKQVKKTINEFKKEIKSDPGQLVTRILNEPSLKNGGELSYKVRGTHYDKNGNWKNLI